MEKSMKRSIRRHHVSRLKNKRRKYWGFGLNNHRDEEMDPRRLGMVSQYPSTCSCHMCGNPRKFWKQDTLEEELHQLIMDEELKEL